MKRRLLLPAAVVALGLCLAGCAQTNNGTTTTSTDGSTQWNPDPVSKEVKLPNGTKVECVIVATGYANGGVGVWCEDDNG